MNRKLFGKTNENQDVYEYEISSKRAKVTLIDYGARITGFSVNGVDVAQGFDSLTAYLEDPYNVGATVGRVANRIKNGVLTVEGVSYELTKNSKGNCLHGGNGIQNKVWERISHSENEITFFLSSPDGDNGFPGKLSVFATFTIADTALIINYRAVSDRKTAISLTSHPYFNLDGYECGTDSHTLTLYADRYTEVDNALIPTGNRPSVDKTPYDFRSPKSFTRDLSNELSNYDINFWLSPTVYKDFSGKRLALGAVVRGKSLELRTYTDQKCIQLYTPTYSGGLWKMKGNVERRDFCAFCLEAQIEPNSVNLGDGIYEAGEVYKSTCVYEIEVTDK